MKRLRFTPLIPVAVTVCVVACGSGGPSGNGSGGGTIPCSVISDGEDTDCTAQNMPRKMDCETADAQQAALAAGCVKEDADDPTDFDACCPTAVSGERRGGGLTSTVACEQKSDADDNPECSSFPGKPRKLDCDSAQTGAALEAGCVRQTPTSSDVCCPTSVHGTEG